MLLQKLHHVAYRCRDAQETVDFYTKILGMKFAAALVQDYIPSIQKEDPHNHIFFEMEDGSFLAFFDVLSDEDMIPEGDRDWAQHLALEVKTMDALLDAKRRLEAAGVEVVGPTDHHICQSIYFYDPSGHRMEMTYRTDSAAMWQKSATDAAEHMAKWNAMKRQRAQAAE